MKPNGDILLYSTTAWLGSTRNRGREVSDAFVRDNKADSTTDNRYGLSHFRV